MLPKTKLILLSLVLFAATLGTSALAAQDASIDRLIRKLPPPEKLVDPASNDPLAKQAVAAARQKNFGIALDSARRLSQRYPKSAGAQMFYGMLAVALHQFADASAAFRKAIAVRPDLTAAYAGLGVAEASQRHFSAAFSSFQQLTRLAPNADAGWVGSSACAEQLGKRQESLTYARRGTIMAPSSAAAWYQLAREESLFGSKAAAAEALARATQLRKKAAERHPRRS
jgi:tetratricopeptide (TPR) repeat protein